jgi:hypothetical protein
MRTNLQPQTLLLVFVAAVLVAGCSDSYGGRMEVSGGVTLQGQPLPKGVIHFAPLDQQDTDSGAPVTNGEYKIPRKGGLKPGKYLVQITAGDGKTPNDEEAAAPGGSTNIVSMDLIPEEWNIRSTKQIEVSAHRANKFDFVIPNVNTPKKKR